MNIHPKHVFLNMNILEKKKIADSIKNNDKSLSFYKPKDFLNHFFTAEDESIVVVKDSNNFISSSITKKN